MTRLARLVGVVLLSVCATASANEVRVVDPLPPPATTPTPTPETQPAEVEVAPPAPTEAPPQTGLVIQEVPPPPPNYGPTTVMPGTQPTTPMLAPPPSSPPPVRAPRPGHRTHDGFFFRGTTSLSAATVVEENAGESLRVSGSGLQITLACGSALSDTNLVLYGEFQGTSVDNVSVRVNDEPRHNVNNLFAGSLGVGASYYLMPLNLYVAGTLGFGSVNLYRSERSSDPDGSTGTGLSLRASVGKEWWTSSNWGIGVAAQVLLMSLPDSGDSTLTFLSVGIGVSATYN